MLEELRASWSPTELVAQNSAWRSCKLVPCWSWRSLSSTQSRLNRFVWSVCIPIDARSSNPINSMSRGAYTPMSRIGCKNASRPCSPNRASTTAGVCSTNAERYTIHQRTSHHWCTCVYPVHFVRSPSIHLRTCHHQQTPTCHVLACSLFHFNLEIPPTSKHVNSVL